MIQQNNNVDQKLKRRYIMVPEKMVNYFIASTGASAALVGLIFVAISLAPKETVMSGAAPERRAVAGSSFLALVNIFFISLAALNTSDTLGWPVLVLSTIGLVHSLWLGIPLFTRKRSRGRLIPNILLVLLSLVVYANELYHAVNLLHDPGDASNVYGLAGTLQYVYAIGLVRAWELLGVEQIGIGRWLNPLRIVSPSQKNTEKPSPDEQQRD
jgi:hypothetical protein